MPYGLETGKPEANSKALAATVGFDPSSGKLTAIPNPQTHALVPANYNLATIQGGGEVMFELVPLLGRADFADAWLKLCRLGVAPPEVWDKDRTTHNEGADAEFVPPGQSGPRLAAYAYAKTGKHCLREEGDLPAALSGRRRRKRAHGHWLVSTHSAQLRKTPGCRPTRHRKPRYSALRCSSYARISSPPRQRFVLRANSLQKARRRQLLGNVRVSQVSLETGWISRV